MAHLLRGKATLHHPLLEGFALDIWLKAAATAAAAAAAAQQVEQVGPHHQAAALAARSAGSSAAATGVLAAPGAAGRPSADSASHSSGWVGLSRGVWGRTRPPTRSSGLLMLLVSIKDPKAIPRVPGLRRGAPIGPQFVRHVLYRPLYRRSVCLAALDRGTTVLRGN